MISHATRSFWHPGILTVVLRASLPSGHKQTRIYSRTTGSRTTTSHWTRWRWQARPLHFTFTHMSKKRSSTHPVIMWPVHLQCMLCNTPLTDWRRSQRTFASSTSADSTCCQTFSTPKPVYLTGSRDFPHFTSRAKRTQWSIKRRKSCKWRATDSTTSRGKCRATYGRNCTWKRRGRKSLSKYRNGLFRRTCRPSIDCSISLSRRSFVRRHEKVNRQI